MVMSTHSWWRGERSSKAFAPASPGGITPVSLPAAPADSGTPINARSSIMIPVFLIMVIPSSERDVSLKILHHFRRSAIAAETIFRSGGGGHAGLGLRSEELQLSFAYGY